MGVDVRAIFGVQSDLTVAVVYGPTGEMCTQCECGVTKKGELFCPQCGTKPTSEEVNDFTAAFKQLCADNGVRPEDVGDDIKEAVEYGAEGDWDVGFRGKLKVLRGISLWDGKFSVVVETTGSSRGDLWDTPVSLKAIPAAVERLNRFCTLMGHPDATVKGRLSLSC